MQLLYCSLSDCFSHTGRERRAFLKTNTRQAGLMEKLHETTRVSPHSSSSIHNHKINIYTELLGIVETFLGMFDTRTFFSSRNFLMKNGNATSILCECITAALSHNVKALPIPLRNLGRAFHLSAHLSAAHRI